MGLYCNLNKPTSENFCELKDDFIKEQTAWFIDLHKYFRQ